MYACSTFEVCGWRYSYRCVTVFTWVIAFQMRPFSAPQPQQSLLFTPNKITAVTHQRKDLTVVELQTNGITQYVLFGVWLLLLSIVPVSQSCCVGYFVLLLLSLLSHVWLFVTPWTEARQASLSFTFSWSLLKLMSIELVMPSSHLIFCQLISFCPQPCSWVFI